MPHADSLILTLVGGFVLAFVFGMTGPAVSVDTACSSALVAAHVGLADLAVSAATSAVLASAHVFADAFAHLTFAVSIFY